MADFSRFPDSHRRMHGRYLTRLENGTEVGLEISHTSRPLRGNELVKASIATRTGRLVSHRVDEDVIAIFIGRAGRMEIEITNSGQYRHGRYMHRSLRGLAEQLVDRFAPQVRQEPEAKVPGTTFSR